MQPSLFTSEHFTVSRITFHIRKLLEEDVLLQDVWVDGEISNLSRPNSGHIYFTLKDRSASLRCVMWKVDAARLRVLLQDGMAVEAHGRIAVYEPQGSYQLIVNMIHPKGDGTLFQEFTRLKTMLEGEGLFDSSRKKLIPPLPNTIGIVTSESGAALQDMLNTIRRRMPLATVILAPTLVQGEQAPDAIVRALRSLRRMELDVILLARGGGSIEDLWAFNDERVVRAVADSPIPIVCGVGHETDFTLSDFAADLRAPTPTAAAELATSFTLQDLRDDLIARHEKMDDLIFGLLNEKINQFSVLCGRMRYVSPQRRVQTESQILDDLANRSLRALENRQKLSRSSLDGAAKRLQSLNPSSVLERGYAVVIRLSDGRVVSRVEQAERSMKIRVSDGIFEVNRNP